MIEALEQQEPDGWSAIGVQWHPEKMQEEVEQRLFMQLNATDRAHTEMLPAIGELCYQKTGGPSQDSALCTHLSFGDSLK